ncbi:hypothetical protein HOY80DRAFT_169338 [Tuber brumale]|nr:hypothetical protein HOY80DRAFT_169338 [Tuber brumale]
MGKGGFPAGKKVKVLWHLWSLGFWLLAFLVARSAGPFFLHCERVVRQSSHGSLPRIIRNCHHVHAVDRPLHSLAYRDIARNAVECLEWMKKKKSCDTGLHPSQPPPYCSTVPVFQ